MYNEFQFESRFISAKVELGVSSTPLNPLDYQLCNRSVVKFPTLFLFLFSIKARGKP